MVGLCVRSLRSDLFYWEWEISAKGFQSVTGYWGLNMVEIDVDPYQPEIFSKGLPCMTSENSSMKVP